MSTFTEAERRHDRAVNRIGHAADHVIHKALKLRHPGLYYGALIHEKRLLDWQERRFKQWVSNV